MDLQTYAAIIFVVLLTYFLIKHREKLYLQKIAFPFLYFAMYRTKFGLNFIDKMSEKIPRIVKWTAYAGVVLGFIGMAFISFSLVYNLIRMLMTPAATAGVALVLPFKVKGSFYVPFFYWIISIFVLAVIHEFAHGIVARAYGLKIKSSGFAFLGVLVPILPAAFVEPDEKELNKEKAHVKLSIFAAGPFSNIVFAALVALLFIFLLAPVGNAIFEPTGVQVAGYVPSPGNVTYPAEQANIKKGEVILKINNVDVPSIENFTVALNSTKPGDRVTVVTNVSSYEVTLAEDPENVNRSYLGVFVRQNSRISEGFTEKYGNILTSALIWLIGLFYWFYVLNLGIGLFNLVPLGPIDGGRMLHTILEKYLRKDIALKAWKFIGTLFLFIIIASIVFAFVK